ncbi:MAG: AMP-binding protein [Armatimonadetes bacterium]|nr:AMP-binding protein [Armatimonadota bacterium]
MSESDQRDTAEIEAGQLAKLRSLLTALVPANAFYTRKLAAAGVTAEIASLGEFCARTPFTTKQEIVDDQLSHPPYGTNLTFPQNRYTRFNQTSSTTGNPLHWLDTEDSWSWMLDCWSIVYEAAGVRPEDRVLFAFSFGPFLGFWTAFEAAERLGCLCIPGGGMSSEARLNTITNNEVTVVCCTPTYAIRLGEVATEQGVDLGSSKVRRVIVAGEPGGSIPATRSRLESLWPGARVFDHHGMTETGPVSFECPAQPGVLHVIESAYLPEVINPATGGPVGSGETGELVLTNLGRLGSPLLRYRTGDLVRRRNSLHTQCICGRRDMALEGGILGRVDDMVIVRGVNVFPGAIEEIIRSFPEIAEYRVEVQTTAALTELRIQVEPSSSCANASELCDKLQTALQSVFHLRIPISSAQPGSLPRFEMKAKRWIKT